MGINSKSFQALSSVEVFVLGSDRNLWHSLEPFTRHEQVDGDVAVFQALSSTQVFVLGTDGKLWLETGPFRTGNVPPPRRPIDDHQIVDFQALSEAEIFVLDDEGTLFLDTVQLDSIERETVFGNIIDFQALSNTEVFLIFEDGALGFLSGETFYILRSYYDRSKRDGVPGVDRRQGSRTRRRQQSLA